MITNRRYWQAVALVTGMPDWVVRSAFNQCARATQAALATGPATIPVLASRLGYAQATIRQALLSLQRLGFVDRANNVWSLAEGLRPHRTATAVILDGVTYASYAAAARAEGVSRQAICQRVQRRTWR